MSVPQMRGLRSDLLTGSLGPHDGRRACPATVDFAVFRAPIAAYKIAVIALLRGMLLIIAANKGRNTSELPTVICIGGSASKAFSSLVDRVAFTVCVASQ